MPNRKGGRPVNTTCWIGCTFGLPAAIGSNQEEIAKNLKILTQYQEKKMEIIRKFFNHFKRGWKMTFNRSQDDHVSSTVFYGVRSRLAANKKLAAKT